MNNEISMELSKGEILDRYVKKFLNRIAYKEGIEMLEFSNTLIKEVEDILFELDLNSSYDSYISLVSLEEFKQVYTKYIDNAKEKRDRLHEFNIYKRM